MRSWLGHLLWMLLLAGALISPWTGSAAAAERPNIVMIVSDDQPASTFEPTAMPQTFKKLLSRGTYFSDANVVVPLCCPSRATMLTGQYPHNHNVLSNKPGYPALVDKRNVLPTWLQRAGYRTAHLGKWLHSYESFAGQKGREPAPGWDHWFTQLSPRRYYNYRISNDGRKLKKEEKGGDHVTRVVTREAKRWIGEAAPRRKPFYLQVDYYAPHQGSGIGRTPCVGGPLPEPGDRKLFKGRTAPRGPSFNEEEIDDKPYWMQTPLLDERQLRNLDRRYACTLASVFGMDRGIGKIFKAVKRERELRNTVFIFLTDNGFMFGEHRLRAGKSRAFRESIGTPLVIRWPKSISAGMRDGVSEVVGSIDLAPTILDLAGGEPCLRNGCRTLDGRSLVPLAAGNQVGFEDRALLIEMDEGPITDKRGFACAFRALRSSELNFVENTRIPSRETRICEQESLIEHYDLDSDPFELRNLFSPTGIPSVEQLQLQSRLESLADCAGISGRDQRVGSRPYCE